MEFTRQDSPFKKRKNSAEIRNIRKISQTLNDNNNESEKQKIIKQERYSLFVKNLAKSKRFKSLEKRQKNILIDNKEQIEQKEPTYIEKFKRSMKPKETFQSTTKNPKINEILRQLRESEERGNLSVNNNNNINIGKIDTNKINQFLQNRYGKINNEEDYNIYEPKVKNYIEQLNKKILEERNSSERIKNKKETKIKKNLKNNEFNEDEEIKFNLIIDNEYRGIKNEKDKYKIKQQINNNTENFNNFYNQRKDQEKYINQKNNIDYYQFTYNSYKIKDKKYKDIKNIKKQNSEIKKYIPKNQVNFSILRENSKQRKKSDSNSIQRIKGNKIKVKKKKSTDNYCETEGNENVKLYDIIGYDNIKRRMSIYDILKKRKISIISEEPFSLKKKRNSRSIKLVNKDNKENKTEMETIEEKPELHKYNEIVKYIIYSNPNVTNNKKNKKFNLNDFKIIKIANIELKNKEIPKIIKQDKEVDNNKNNNKNNNINNIMIIEKKNDIQLSGYRKRSSNSMSKKKNSINKENKSINNTSYTISNKKNINVRPSLNKDKDNKNNKAKLNPNSLLLNKHTLQNRINLKTENKSTERRHIKSSILFDSNSSSSSKEEEEFEEKEFEAKKEIKKIKNNIPKRLNQYDELFDNYARNYKRQNIPRKISKSFVDENTLGKNNSSLKKTNLSKNKRESRYMYIEKETNESRALFKNKLKTSNKLINDDLTLSKKEINKVKTSKAKIRQFKSKNMLEKKQTSTDNKKSSNLNNKKYIDKSAKIKQFHGHRNFNSEYINNSNIILQNTTVNHTTYNYYLNGQDKLTTSKKNKKKKKKK